MRATAPSRDMSLSCHGHVARAHSRPRTCTRAHHTAAVSRTMMRRQGMCVHGRARRGHCCVLCFDISPPLAPGLCKHRAQPWVCGVCGGKGWCSLHNRRRTACKCPRECTETPLAPALTCAASPEEGVDHGMAENEELVGVDAGLCARASRQRGDLTSERPAVSAHVGAKDKALQARRGG